MGGVEGVRCDDRAAQGGGAGHCRAVADGIVLVGVLLTRRVIGGGQAIEGIVGVADAARDAADGLRDARAVAGGVQRVGVVRQHGGAACVEQGGQAAGGDRKQC